MIVILTALDFEGAAVRAHLSGLRPHHHQAGTIFEVGHLADRPSCEVALAVIGMGTVNAAAITERAIAEFRPSAVVFVGVAGALRDWVKLGDIVVATRVYAHQGGRVDDDEFLARPRAWDTSHRLVHLAKHVRRSKAWPGADQTPAEVHFEPVAAGDVVLNSSNSPERARLRAHYNDAAAVEMESAGVALAGRHLHESTPTIAVRGISDLAGGAKHNSDGQGWQAVAARHAASFAIGLVTAVDDHASSPARPPVASPAPPSIQPPQPFQERTAPAGYTYNINNSGIDNTGGAYIGSILATAPVRIKQKVVNYAKRHPRRFALIVVALVIVVGGGGYLGVNALLPAEQASSAGSPGHAVLATSSGAACGLRSDRTAQCWGEAGSYSPPVGGLASISLAKELGCGLRADGTAVCWTPPSTGTRPDLLPSGRFQSVATGCGVRVDGTLHCWIGDDQPPAGKFSSLAHGQYGAWCGVRDDKSVTCWNPSGPALTDVPPGPFETVSVGGYHACGLRTDNTLACWGKDDERQASPPTGQFTAVTTGEEHSCALRTDQTVVCWGRAKDGQTEPPGGPFAALGAGTGGEYSCGLRADGTPECWGRLGRYAPPPGKLATSAR
ncbi:hypothetical protein [Kibdelosporangium phytohabitans]|uniref:Nucleoside phosphorylase domain-containing protein n=1 Tax=Kibdelosporangium phytohabitans TaxID=860235 RepID=A0A0N9I1J0_9PSEU|nr:hypothetical protein [Kibdelosporangium phytohabitans]ALG09892.1 hypothetical protein AOZ06_26015 [Kibdelosporangium phytohabitans]MBE1468705.1 5'-methylthioadenosine/S-adenosylhomocysteine nucleosidase [Kibdelosporangium phytohabitans]